MGGVNIQSCHPVVVQTRNSTANLMLKRSYFSLVTLALYRTRFHLIFRFPAWSKRNIILTESVSALKGYQQHFSGGKLKELEHLKSVLKMS